jgi:hypothetical protein
MEVTLKQAHGAVLTENNLGSVPSEPRHERGVRQGNWKPERLLIRLRESRAEPSNWQMWKPYPGRPTQLPSRIHKFRTQ